MTQQKIGRSVTLYGIWFHDSERGWRRELFPTPRDAVLWINSQGRLDGARIEAVVVPITKRGLAQWINTQPTAEPSSTHELTLFLMDFVAECNPKQNEYVPPSRALCESAMQLLTKGVQS